MKQLPLRRFETNPALFRSKMRIDSADGSVQLFKPDPWQEEELAQIDKLWLRALGKSDTGPKRAYIGRSRGHSKTTDEALAVLWLLALSRKKIKGLVAASSREQAQILRDQILTLVMLNPWLAKTIDVQNYVVRNVRTQSQLDIISSDAASSYGEIVDFIICDELTHWKNDELWKSVFSTAGKRLNCVLLVLTNAGYMHTWQRKVHDMAKASDDWLFIHHDGPKASWITASVLKEQETGLPAKAYARLWLNIWQIEGGDELGESDVLAAVKKHLKPMFGNEPEWTFVGGIDLSTKRHRSALVMLAASQERQVVRLAGVKSFQRGENGMIDLVAVQSAFREWHRQFSPAVWCYDPHQAALMAQQAQVDGILMREVSFGSRGLGQMASAILQIFRSRQIELYDDKELVADILKLRIVEKAFGMKLEAPEDESGHADRAFALAVAIPAAIEYASIVPIRCFVNRSMLTTLDDMRQKLHNLDKEAQIEMQGKIDAALAEAGQPLMAQCAKPDARPEMDRIFEENAIVLEPDEPMGRRWDNSVRR